MSQSILEPVEEHSAVIGEHSARSSQPSAHDEEHSVVSPLIEPLRHKTARAAMTSGGADVVTRVLTIALSIATARALDPGEVGSLALAVIVIGIISMIASYTETAAVVCRSEGSDGQYALAATVIRGAITGILVAIALLALQPTTHLLAGKEGAEPQLAALVGVLIWQPVLELASCYPRVTLMRRLDLTYLAVVNLIQVVIHVGLSVALLWTGYGPMGVVWSSLITAGLTSVMLWPRLARVRLHQASSAVSKKLWWQTALETVNVFSGGFIGYINTRLDNLLVAGALGPSGMSFYAMAWNASRTPVLVFSSAFSSVLMPTLARIQDDTERVKRALCESLQHSYVILAPVSMAMFLYAGTIVPLVLGAKWTPMIPCLQIMAITILFTPLIYAWQALFIVNRRAFLTSIPAVAHILLLAVLMIPVTRWKGLLGAAYVDLAGVATVGFLGIALNAQFRRMLSFDIVLAVLMPIATSVLAGSIGVYSTSFLSEGTIRQSAQLGVALVAYPAILRLLGGRRALSDLIRLFSGIVRSRTLAGAVRG
jgi:O-antigen/teichoic acid export membrane protein